PCVWWASRHGDGESRDQPRAAGRDDPRGPSPATAQRGQRAPRGEPEPFPRGGGDARELGPQGRARRVAATPTRRARASPPTATRDAAPTAVGAATTYGQPNQSAPTSTSTGGIPGSSSAASAARARNAQAPRAGGGG